MAGYPHADVTPSQFIDRIEIELDQRGWTKGLTEDDNGCVCLYGAIHKAFDYYSSDLKRWFPHIAYWEDWGVSETAVLTIWELARQRTEPRAAMQHIHPEAIVFFNDGVAESVDDIKQLLADAKRQLNGAPIDEDEE